MWTVGPLSFAAPLALLALAALPLLWWLLRVTPPAPRRVVFPPLRLLRDLRTSEQHAVRTPPWLLLLRLLLAALLILAAARPVHDAGGGLAGSGPVMLVVDDGWAAAPTWEERHRLLLSLIEAAERHGRGVVLVTTAAAVEPPPLRVLPAVHAREAAAALQPKAWATDRPAALARIDAMLGGPPPDAVFWLSDGLVGPGEEASRPSFAQALLAFGSLTVIQPRAIEIAPLLKASSEGYRLTVTVLRAAADAEVSFAIRLLAGGGTPIARHALPLAAGTLTAAATMPLPAEWLAQLERVEIDAGRSAGAVVLIDERWRRRPVGIVSDTGPAAEQPLLGRAYYLERALEPFAEVRTGSIDSLLSREIAALVIPDVGRLDAETANRVQGWVEGGGVLLRFAGPRLAAASSQPEADTLLPVMLRPGERTLGGTLSWGEPGRLAGFDASGPLAGLAAPTDVVVERHVLAEPSLEIATQTWARLGDGTPLITGAARGAGWVVLVHTTANLDWSNLPISGVFVEVLRRIVELGRGSAARPTAPALPPQSVLDGFGRLGPPPADARPVAAADIATQPAGPHHPPGFYGQPGATLALNLSASIDGLIPLPPLPAGVDLRPLAPVGERDLRPPLLAAALLLLLVDFAVALALRGLFVLPLRTGRWPAAAVALLLAAAAGPAGAETIVADGSAPPASLTPQLAYVITGQRDVDTASAAGLAGLTAVINRRTAVELGPPAGVRPGQDDLAFYPLLYWPLPEPAPIPTPRESRALAAYMRAGGTILFDTRGGRGFGGREDLRRFARALDLPPLVPLAGDHVLTRAYYLLSDVPGRLAGGTLWVEAGGDTVNDGVSSVIAGGNDWAGAWAIDEAQRPLHPVVPGGERQREIAYRFGVNLVMYVLTGNYKADQVHVPAILERLKP